MSRRSSKKAKSGSKKQVEANTPETELEAMPEAAQAAPEEAAPELQDEVVPVESLQTDPASEHAADHAPEAPADVASSEVGDEQRVETAPEAMPAEDSAMVGRICPAEIPLTPEPQGNTDFSGSPETAAATGAAVKAAKPRAKKEAGPKKLSALDAAAQVLKAAGQPMTCPEMIEAMSKQGLWSSPNGATPAATLYSAILRELKKGALSRFEKTDRGKFTATRTTAS